MIASCTSAAIRRTAARSAGIHQGRSLGSRAVALSTVDNARPSSVATRSNRSVTPRSFLDSRALQPRRADGSLRPIGGAVVAQQVRNLSSTDKLPDHIVMGMPALSPTMTTGTISKWNVSDGSSFSAGDSLAVIETDKATIDFEAQDDGFVAKLLVPAGDAELEVGVSIMVTVDEEADCAAFANFASDVAVPAAAEPAHAEAAPVAPAEDLPYHIVVGMPALSPTMDAGTISKWNMSEGDSFGAGDSLAVIETDKASMDFEAQDDGVVAKLLIAEGGGEVAVGTPIMVTVEEQNDVAAFANFEPGSAGDAPEAAPAEAEAAPSPPAVAPSPPPTPTVDSAPTPGPAPAVVAEVARAAAPAPPSAGEAAPWGRLAGERSPLAKALAAKHREYVKKYGSTGHAPIA